jgi:PAS domain S-box-containing protein
MARARRASLRLTLIALAAVAGATAVRLVLDPLIGRKGVYTFFEVGVVLAALKGGFTAGIIATLLSVAIVDYLFVEPRYAWFSEDAPADLIMLLAFSVLGFTVSGVIGQWRKTRESLRHSVAALQESELIRTLAATVPGILMTATPEGSIDYISDAFRIYTGAVSGHWIEAVHPEDQSRVMDAWSESLRTGQDLDVTYRLRSANGDYRWFQAYAKAVKDTKGRITKWSAIAIDIEEQKHLQQALARRSQELLETSGDFQRFAYRVGHDLQEPLRNVGIYTELLALKGREVNAEEREALMQPILEGVQRIRRQLAQLIEYARSGNYQPESTPVDLNAVVETALSNLRPTIEETGAAVTYEPLPTVAADHDLILSVFQNLIGNALKYRGEAPPRVHISNHKTDHEDVIAVRDNGIGFKMEDAERIFAAFERINTGVQGTGLGLTIVRRIVERRGGRIWAESKPGEGSTFYFTIPAAVPVPESPAATAA